MDTVKTRLVTQMNYPDLVAYKGINDCFRTVLKEEGIGAFYRGLTPRLLSVVPMIGIQFGIYEVRTKVYLVHLSFHRETFSLIVILLCILFILCCREILMDIVYEEVHDCKGCPNIC